MSNVRSVRRLERVTLALVRTLHKVKSDKKEESAWVAALSIDGDAFVEIFDMHQSRIYRHALRLTANTHDAEDVTATAFLELWRHRKSVRLVDGSVLPWLLVTTTNLVRHHARGLRRYRSLLAALPRNEILQSAEDITAERAEEVWVAAQLQQALNSLAPSDAALLALISIERYSPSQAAVALGISDGAARTRLHRARARLTVSLESLVETMEAKQ
jgi:RNA polymerase sigma-70 factor (ECF subfamily)